MEKMNFKNYFIVTLKDDKGETILEKRFPNAVTTVGKNLTLDTMFSGSGYTTTGPYIGIISSVGFSAISIADTMASHAGWTEAGPTNAPEYSGVRKTLAFSAASGGSKTTSSPASFTFSASGTIKGCFVVFGSGASSTKDNTGGTLFSAGLFVDGDIAVTNGYVLTVVYVTQL